MWEKMRLGVVLNMSKILFFMGILKTEIGKMVENVWVSMEGPWADVSDTCVRTNYRLWSHGGYWMMLLWYELQMWVRGESRHVENISSLDTSVGCFILLKVECKIHHWLADDFTSWKVLRSFEKIMMKVDLSS